MCDIIMPELDGFGSLRHTRADKRLRTIPFIFLTARFSAEDKRKAKIIGIEGYPVKPVDLEDLILFSRCF
jgi:two-component system, sensor histidine kinase and response regulator